MIIAGRRASFLLFIGDIAVFVLALLIALWIRSGDLPTASTLAPFAVPFSYLFIIWLLVFYGAGLYGKQLTLFPLREPDLLIKTQLVNIVIAALFFFVVPVFGITPKTILVVYFIVSVALIFGWRLALYPALFRRVRRERAVFITDGSAEAGELLREVNGNGRYGIELIPLPLASSTPDTVVEEVRKTRSALLVANTALSAMKRLLPAIYRLTRLGEEYQFSEFEALYEEVFDRIPLSQLEHGWFLEKIAVTDAVFFTIAKRFIDIIGGIAMGVVTLILAPVVYAANLFEHPGPLFIRQERLGRYGTHITVYKFRSMEKNLPASDTWTNEGGNRVTRIGAFLRHTSLDEFPQFLNVISGSLSLIGPRSDILGLGKRLIDALPYYEARYVVKPGITGWAQINQQYEPGNVSPQSIEENKMRLAYDFYYLKHRSLELDAVIALKTVKRMFARTSRR